MRPDRVRTPAPPEDEQALGPVAPAPPSSARPLPSGDPESAARTIVLRLLDRRAYTRAELVAVLRRREIPDAAAVAVLDRFAEVGLVDDTELARGLALAVHRERGLARRAVAVKLRRRGVEDADIRAAVEQIEPDSERAAAQALVARKLRSMSGLEPTAQARRLVGMLARRGYAPGLAHEIVRQALAGTDSGELPVGLTAAMLDPAGADGPD